MNISRFLLQDLIKWRRSKNRKPLILNGVRQCGKTWLLREFGKQEFKSVLYLNFERDLRLPPLFASNLDPINIIQRLEAFTNTKIVPEETLLIFDEIQTCPRALTSLKYFYEEAPEYVIAAAGSLLGICLTEGTSFPVGKVHILYLKPCSFKEFLAASAPLLVEYLEKIPLEPLSEGFAAQLGSYLREYLAFGGMPEALSNWMETHDLETTESRLDLILQTYESDFSKHIPPNDTPKLYGIWNSIPAQFARENKRFFFSEVREGARARDLEDAMQWLLNASMIYSVQRVNKPELPLLVYADRKIFKLYLADVGVLRRLARLDPGPILNSQDVFSDFNGRLAENFVLEQLQSMKISPICYWTSESGRAEVDFLIQNEDRVIPIETKSGMNVKAKSLRMYREKYKPKLAVRFSMQNLRLDGGLLNVPLYLIGEFPRLLKLALEQI